MDALVGSGVDQLTLIDERDIKIQLPCNDRNFAQQVPCLTETLRPGNWLRISPGDLDTDTLIANMGIMAYFIRHISIRKRVLRYVHSSVLVCGFLSILLTDTGQIYQTFGRCYRALGS
jgi:hypothetical protein